MKRLSKNICFFYKTQSHKISFVIFLTILSLNQSFAQSSYNSTRQTLGGLLCDKEIVCDYLERYVVTYSHNNSSLIRHYFTIQDMTTNTTKRIPLNIGYDPITPTTYFTRFEINDMKVGVNGLCYFCGTRINKNNTSTKPDSNGFIGRFSIADAMGSGGNFDILIIPETNTLTRIEPRGNYQQIFAIGLADVVSFATNTKITYLVGLEQNLQTLNWYYDIVEPVDPFEQFTDVAHSAGIIVSSKYHNNNYTIGIRHTKNGPLSDNTNLSLLQNCNKYDMQYTTLPSSGVAVAYRKNYDPILLSSIGGDVTMAHSCNSSSKGIAAYLLYVANLGDARISKIRYASSSNYLSLINTCSYFLNSRAYFLTKDASSHVDRLSWTNWSATGSSFPFSETLFNSSDMTCQGMARYYKTTEYFYIGGYNSSNTPKYYAQNLSPAGLIITCFPSSTSNSFYPLSVPSFTSGSGVSKVKTLKPVYTLFNPSFTPATVTPTPECNY